MEKSRETAAQAAKTKPVWGIVAVIGVMVAVTMGDSLIMAAIGTAMLAAGAYLGGYMDNGMLNDECRMQNEERRAA